MSRRYSLVAIVITLAILSLPMFGQAFYGSIVGTVTDASNAAMAGASVTLINLGTGDRRTATTDPDGSYRFVSLVPGSYRVEVEQAGFKRHTRDQIPVNVEAVVRIDIPMQVGDVTQAVDVRAVAPLLQTESANLSQIVGSRAVQELPLNGRNILNLVALVPGVAPQGNSEGSSSFDSSIQHATRDAAVRIQ